MILFLRNNCFCFSQTAALLYARRASFLSLFGFMMWFLFFPIDWFICSAHKEEKILSPYALRNEPFAWRILMVRKFLKSCPFWRARIDRFLSLSAGSCGLRHPLNQESLISKLFSDSVTEFYFSLFILSSRKFSFSFLSFGAQPTILGRPSGRGEEFLFFLIRWMKYEPLFLLETYRNEKFFKNLVWMGQRDKGIMSHHLAAPFGAWCTFLGVCIFICML